MVTFVNIIDTIIHVYLIQHRYADQEATSRMDMISIMSLQLQC